MGDVLEARRSLSRSAILVSESFWSWKSSERAEGGPKEWREVDVKGGGEEKKWGNWSDGDVGDPERSGLGGRKASFSVDPLKIRNTTRIHVHKLCVPPAATFFIHGLE